MTKLRLKGVALGAGMLALTAVSAQAASGWPSQHEGVMLQGFYWDSYKGANDSKWTTLTSQSDELSQYFNLIWIPNSARAASNPGMGYDPVYWFSNYNTAFGTEAQLKTMISTFKEKGTGIIADVVINHRSGVSNWTNFPAETWNGKTYQLGPQHICRDDEVAYASGQAKPTGNYDTGDNFDGSRDLDHTNATVQQHCSDYCKFLLQEMGFAGFRLDMVKGYGGQYTKIYNQASNPTYCVGEYWDGQYDALKNWIEATGRTSAAFDFSLKYVLNDAFTSKDYSKLVWKANGTTDQPAGLIHFGYPRYAVTFVDNHDTYRDGSKFNGNVLAANAFILSSPGTPCVFLVHWQEHKEALKPMIEARLEAGIHNESSVRVLKTGRDIYMAEATGKYGTMVVKIGSAQVTPDGYTNADLRCAGNDYCIWVKSNGSVVPPPPPVSDEFDVYYDNTMTSWTTPHIHYWGSTASAWPGVKMTKYQGNIWKYTVPAGTTGILFNAGDGDASKTSDFLATANYVYTAEGPRGDIDSYIGGGDPVTGNYPANVYVIGNLEQGEWSTSRSVAQSSKANGVYTWDKVVIKDSEDGFGYFSFVTAQGADWDAVNASDRYGAASKDLLVNQGVPVAVTLFPKNVSASSAYAWKINPGTYTMSLDLTSNRLSVTRTTATGIVLNESEPAETLFFNLQGQRVENPGPGLYIMVRNGEVSKVLVR